VHRTTGGQGDALCTRPMLRGAGECGGALDLRCGAVRLFVNESCLRRTGTILKRL